MSRRQHYFYRTLELIMIALRLSYSRRAADRFLRSALEQPYDVAIVPGVPFYGHQWSLIMKARVCWAVYLYQQGAVRNVIFSGAAVYTPYTEARIMALYAIAMGIPEKHVIIEGLAEHSTENALYGYKLAKKMGYERIALASDSFQTKLLINFMKKRVSSELGLIPVSYGRVDTFIRTLPEPEIDPVPAYIENFIPLHKRESMSRRLRGTRGKNINRNIYEDLTSS